MTSLHKKFLFTFVLMAFGLGNATAAIINLDGMQHVKGGGVAYSPLVVPFDAGNWFITPLQDQYVAFSPWAQNTNCTSTCDGQNGQGWGHYYGITIDGVEILDPSDTHNGVFYDDPNDALANAVQGLSFFLVSPTNVEFYIPTGDPLSDNRGGISLDVSLNPVPIPAALWLFGSGILALLGIARRKVAV